MKGTVRMQGFDADMWERRVRTAFWLFGLLVGALLTYTTRYFLNGDGINYIEMGEALKNGVWSGLVNLTESPGYAFLLGLGQIVLDTNRHNELQLLKIVNFGCFVLAMGSCDLFVRMVKRGLRRLAVTDGELLPFPVVAALSYGMFLFMSLAWIRIPVIAPDMMVFALFLATMSVILWISEDSRPYAKFVLLGIVVGLGYLFKSFFFLFSVVIFAVAALATWSLRKAAPRVLVAVLVMLAVGAPLIVSLSQMVGRFSYGEVGNFGYVNIVAGQGEPIHRPKQVHARPTVLFYGHGPGGTFPAGYDLAYWTQGMSPRFDMGIQAAVFGRNAAKLMLFSPVLLIVIAVWLLVQWSIGSLSIGTLRPPSLFILLIAPVVPALGLYCLVHVEPRYLAPFLFVGFVGITTCGRYRLNDSRTRWLAVVSGGILTVFLLVLTVGSAVDQSMRGLRSNERKVSHRQAFLENVATKDFLIDRGVSTGSQVGIVGTPPIPPKYWARLAGMTVVAVVWDAKEFLAAGPQERLQMMNKLRAHQIKALVAKGKDFRKLEDEGWQLIPGTRDWYALVITRGKQSDLRQRSGAKHAEGDAEGRISSLTTYGSSDRRVLIRIVCGSSRAGGT